jgi:hypothetical protein
MLPWGIPSCSRRSSVTGLGSNKAFRSFETKSLFCLEKSETSYPISRRHILKLKKSKWYCFYMKRWYITSSECLKCNTKTFNFQLPNSSHMCSYLSIIRLLYVIALKLYCQLLTFIQRFFHVTWKGKRPLANLSYLLHGAELFLRS